MNSDHKQQTSNNTPKTRIIHWSQAGKGRDEVFMSALHPHLGLHVAAERVHVLLDLGDAQDFLDGRLAISDLGPAVRAERAHALFNRLLGDGRGRGTVQKQRTNGLVDNEQLVYAFAALITELA